MIDIRGKLKFIFFLYYEQFDQNVIWKENDFSCMLKSQQHKKNLKGLIK